MLLPNSVSPGRRVGARADIYANTDPFPTEAASSKRVLNTKQCVLFKPPLHINFAMHRTPANAIHTQTSVAQ